MFHPPAVAKKSVRLVVGSNCVADQLRAVHMRRTTNDCTDRCVELDEVDG